MRNVKQDLANATGKSVGDSLLMGKLAEMYGNRAAARREYDRQNEGSVRDNVSVADKIQLVLAKALEEEDNKPLRGSLPVNSVFNALQIVKANKSDDAGLKALEGHLERKWKRDRSANISADDYLQIRDHYTRNYPRSVVGKVIDEIGQTGYVTLPLSDLMHIASQIHDQEDFDRVVREHGLHTNQPHHVKARNFLLSVVNGR